MDRLSRIRAPSVARIHSLLKVVEELLPHITVRAVLPVAGQDSLDERVKHIDLKPARSIAHPMASQT